MVLSKRSCVVIATTIIMLVVTATALTSTQGMADMLGFFKRYEVHLSPEVSGRVIKNDEPIDGAFVYRTLDYGREYVDKTETDSAGQFSFPAKTIYSSRPGKLFDESRIRQVVGVQHNGRNYLLWYTTLDSVHPRQAIADRLAALNCDLSDPEQELVFDNLETPEFPHSAFSISRWNQ